MALFIFDVAVWCPFLVPGVYIGTVLGQKAVLMVWPSPGEWEALLTESGGGEPHAEATHDSGKPSLPSHVPDRL